MVPHDDPCRGSDFGEKLLCEMQEETDLTPFRDERRVLSNPHKGWYLHYYDNGLANYGRNLRPDDLLEDFPGLATVFIRLPWEVLEPRQGKFCWEIIDREVERWIPTGRSLAFCVTCKETDPAHAHATPRWVQEAGAQGCYIRRPDAQHEAWEPDYGDAVFLRCLEAFHQAFADRYDGKPWIEWVDIGSYGDWGEGHTTASSGREWPVETILEHIALHRRHYKRSRLHINDDHVGSRKNGGSEVLRKHIEQCGLGLTDHGVCVEWFARNFGYSTLRDPLWLKACAQRHPVVLELEHYNRTLETSRWQEGRPLRAAVEEACASFVGFHGDARTWLAANESLAAELANRAGYWLFLHAATLPARLLPGGKGMLALRMENRGVARIYLPIRCRLALTHEVSGQTHLIELPGPEPEALLPGRTLQLRLPFDVPACLAPGNYEAAIGLLDATSGRRIEMALSSRLSTQSGFYRVGCLRVTNYPGSVLKKPQVQTRVQ